MNLLKTNQPTKQTKSKKQNKTKTKTKIPLNIKVQMIWPQLMILVIWMWKKKKWENIFKSVKNNTQIFNLIRSCKPNTYRKTKTTAPRTLVREKIKLNLKKGNGLQDYCLEGTNGWQLFKVHRPLPCSSLLGNFGSWLPGSMCYFALSSLLSVLPSK